MYLIPIIIVAALVLWFITSYNRFVKDKNLIHESWSGIDVQLKRRYDLIPNLIETVKGYSSHEKQLMENITDLRRKTIEPGSPGEKAQSESQLSGMLKSLFAVAENYPDLKANQNFLDLQSQLSEIEDQLQYARRYYNGTVRDYNIRVESFPSNFVANIFNFKKEEFFEITLATERETPKVSFT